MSEQEPQANLPTELDAFNVLEAKVASDGSRRVYGIDGEGKKKQLKGDDVLEAYGYSGREAEEAKINQLPDEVNPYQRIDELKNQIADIDSQRKEHAKWQMKVNTSDGKPSKNDLTADDIAYNMWLEENAENPDTSSKSLRDKAHELSAQEDKERMRESARLGMRVKTGQATGEEAAYYYTLKEAEDAAAGPSQEEADGDSKNNTVMEGLNGLTTEQLIDEFMFARITGNEEDVKSIESILDKHLLEETEGLSEDDKNKYIARLKQAKDNLEVSYLSQLDDFDMTDEQRAHAQEYKNILSDNQMLKMYELTKRQKAVFLDDSISDEEREKIDGDLTSQFENILDLHAALNNLSDDEKSALRDEIAKNVIESPQDDNGEEASEATESSLRSRLKDRWDKIRAGGYALPDRIKTAVGEMKDNGSDEQKKWIKRGFIGAAAVAGAGIVAVLSNKHGIDINPFDGDGFDLNPFNNNGPDVTGGVGGGVDDMATAGPVNGPESMQGLEFTVKPGQGTSQIIKEQLGIDFGNNAGQWEKFNELTNPLFRDMPGTYVEGGAVYLSEGANLSLTPDFIEKIEAARDVVMSS